MSWWPAWVTNNPILFVLLFIMGPIWPTFILWPILTVFGRILGWYLCKKSEGRRSQVIISMDEDDHEYETEQAQSGGKCRLSRDTLSTAGRREVKSFAEKDKNPEWAGVVGFLHPFCNAGGGGERVLWAAIRATQERWPKAKCIVYTGDHGASKHEILDRVEGRFNIKLHRPMVCFLYLKTRDMVLASTWPHFTLLGQSLGSVLMLYDGFSMLVPDVLVDTMGYAFALGFCKYMFPSMPTSAYVHYPTISTDMLDSLDPKSTISGQGINAGQGIGLRGTAKRLYWRLFAFLYSRVGGSVDVIMTNSSWTQSHIQKLWGPHHGKTKNKVHPIKVVYPPVSVTEMENVIEVTARSEARRSKVILYIAQFRPEKNHQLIIQAFAEFIKLNTSASEDAELVLVGSVRDGRDSLRVYELRLLVNELHVRDRVRFHIDATWDEIMQWLAKSSVGVNGMWNEHFGIGVVEYQAAGLIVVAHDSGGPKADIVVDLGDGPTGYHAATLSEFTQAFDKALSIPDPLAIRLRARKSSLRFSEEVFAQRWTEQMEALVGMIGIKRC